MRDSDIAEARKQLKVFRDSICLNTEDKDIRILVHGNMSDEDINNIWKIIKKQHTRGDYG